MSYIALDGRQLPDVRMDLVQLTAAGEPLSPFLLLLFLSRGIFPWCRTDTGQLMWWCPQPRSILLTSEIRINKSLKKVIRRGVYRTTVDEYFDEVVMMCGTIRECTWITEDFSRAYSILHRLGHAHSIEVWEGDQLVGGLFGVCIGGYFCGCSMFHLKPDASKVALVKLTEILKKLDIPMIDCQINNPHLKKMGSRLVSRENFQKTVKILVDKSFQKGRWSKIEG